MAQANRLINETSPYLLQHAYNPVEWYPWGKEALEKAKTEDKLILVSIGYSSCHWCHVMEHESFEDTSVATLMNTKYVCIKIDREERPDIDSIYMEAVQLMGLGGGWPLNVFLTPDKKPVYGGTYFPKQQWTSVLEQLNEAYHGEKREHLLNTSEQVAGSLQTSEIQKYGLTEGIIELSKAPLEQAFAKMQTQFDKTFGGMNNAPKFPMPAIYLFLARFAQINQNKEAIEHYLFSLKKIAWGGIYDQVGGGFARYSVDEQWFAPHFEKMLYDNGQLLSNYSEAYQLSKDSAFKTVIEETIGWLTREMLDANGGFYSALDADSEGVEGKFYTWTHQELASLLGDDLGLFCAYYNVLRNGNWEDGVNILHKKHEDASFVSSMNTSQEVLDEKLIEWKRNLLQKREERIRPGLDDKILLAWNAIAVRGVVDAFKALGHSTYQELAIQTADFLVTHFYQDKQLMHTYKDGEATIHAFLDDYATFIDALIAIYEISGNESYLHTAKELTDHCLTEFYDPKEAFFFFTSQNAEELIARKKEIFDNVIPSSNSYMAKNLFVLGHYFEEDSYKETALEMLGQVQKMIMVEPSYMAHWATLNCMAQQGLWEVTICGKDQLQLAQKLQKEFIPFTIIIFANEASTLAITQEKKEIRTSQLFLCKEKVCLAPINDVNEVLQKLTTTA